MTNRPGGVWIFSILLMVSIILNLIVIGFILGGSDTDSSFFGYFLFYKAIISVCLTSPLLYYFFKLQKIAKRWVHISCGFNVGLSVLVILFMLALSIFTILTIIIVLGMLILIFFWWAIVDYINKKQVDGKLLFN